MPNIKANLAVDEVWRCAGQIKKRLKAKVSTAQVEELVEKELDSILTLGQAQSHLEVLERLLEYVDTSERRLRGRNLFDSVINADHIAIRDCSGERLLALSELKLRAFGKALMLRMPDGARKCYRIAQANESYVSGDDLVVNRLAPVARILVPADLGDVLELPRVGEVTVEAIATLRRDISCHIGDFDGQRYTDPLLSNGRSEIPNSLRKALTRWQDDLDHRLKQVGSSGSLVSAEGLTDGHSSSHDAIPKSPDSSTTASLGVDFYTYTTKEQEEIITGSRNGVVLVTGVAGSGKTSVALGRTKALCDARFFPRESDEWDGFFEPRRAIGFVLNRQLVEYLKETRDTLALHEMPVREYGEFRQGLLRKRAKLLGVRLSQSDPGEFTRARTTENDPECVSMSALAAADRLVAAAYGRCISSAIKSTDVDSLSSHSILHSAWNQIWKGALAACLELSDSLQDSKAQRQFKCKGLAKRIETIISDSQRAIDGKWASVAGDDGAIRWGKPSEVLVKLHAAGYLFEVGRAQGSPQVLRVTSEQVDELLRRPESLREVADPDRPLVRHDKVRIRSLLESGELLQVSDGRISKVVWEQFRLEQDLLAGRVWVRKRGTLGARSRLVGQVDLSKEPESQTERRRLSAFLRKILIDPLRLPVLLREALIVEAKLNTPMVSRAPFGRLLNRLSDRKLSDTDLDMFLALSHMIAEGYGGQVPHLEAPEYFATVFIDEVQDFSEIQIYLMSAHADPQRSAITIVGDFYQRLSGSTVGVLENCFPDVGSGAIRGVFLDRNKRQEDAPTLANLSAWFRKTVLNDPAFSFAGSAPRTEADVLVAEKIESSVARSAIEKIVSSLSPAASIAVICPNEAIAEELERELREPIEVHFRKSAYSVDHRDLTKPYYVHFTTPQAAKGLEFDVVVGPRFEQYDMADAIQANAAYVLITRARKQLHILGERLPFDWV